MGSQHFRYRQQPDRSAAEIDGDANRQLEPPIIAASIMPRSTIPIIGQLLHGVATQPYAYGQCRRLAGRDASPTAALINGQPVS
jgi:hypothetical protein